MSIFDFFKKHKTESTNEYKDLVGRIVFKTKVKYPDTETQQEMATDMDKILMSLFSGNTIYLWIPTTKKKEYVSEIKFICYDKNLSAWRRTAKEYLNIVKGEPELTKYGLISVEKAVFSYIFMKIALYFNEQGIEINIEDIILVNDMIPYEKFQAQMIIDKIHNNGKGKITIS